TVSGSASASASTSPESLICPKLDGAVIASALKVGFAIDCNHGIIGTTLEITVNSKRQAVSLPTTLSNCVDVCSTSDLCVGTTFETSTGVCTYFSAIQSTYIDAALDSALRIGSNSVSEATTTVTVVSTQVQTSTVVLGGGSTSLVTSTVTSTAVQTVCPKCSITSVPSGAQTAAAQTNNAQSTAVVYSTTVVTISSCAPTVTDCPLRAGQQQAVVTTVVPVTSTVYQCPVATNNAVVTALQAAVTVQDVVTSTVYQCPAGQTITVGGNVYTTQYTSSYTTQMTASSSAPSPTGAVSTQTVIYVNKIVSVIQGSTSTQWVIVSTAKPTAATATAITVVQVVETVVPTASGAVATPGAPPTSAISTGSAVSTACNGVNCPKTSLVTSVSSSPSSSQPATYTGAASPLSAQCGLISIGLGLLTFLLF
ncbi:hypothetical protein KCU97_g2820, partial [Aureobasidium melanogenum]